MGGTCVAPAMRQNGGSIHMRSSLFALLTTFALATPAIADQGHDQSTGASDTKPMAAPQDDHAFAMQVAEHHRQGIEMADHVIAHGSNPAVKAMAKRIKAEQQKDLQTLDTHKPSGGAQHHGSSMPKDPDMEKKMAELKAASGAKLDALFLEQMIVHHAGALVAAESAVDKLQDEELRKLAKNNIAMQAREIGELQQLRDGKRAARRASR